jgi:hypothetical protein
MLQICFGKDALITKEARAWVEHVDKFELSYDARFKTVPEFGAKVLGLIDLTFFQFCDSCLKAESFEDVNFAAICLDHDRYCITRNTFQAEIPPFLVLQQKRKSDIDADSDEDSKKLKRLKTKDKEDKEKHHYRDLGNMVKNPHPVNEWKVVGSKYKKTFPKEVMATTPAFNESELIKHATSGMSRVSVSRNVLGRHHTAPLYRQPIEQLMIRGSRTKKHGSLDN